MTEHVAREIPDDPAEIARLLASQIPPGQEQQFIETLLDSVGDSTLDPAFVSPEPEVHPIPERTRGFRLRIDLTGTKPPVWRRIDIAGDTALDDFHHVLQVTMGWTNSHLHRFWQGPPYRSAHFVTAWDVEEGEPGVLEDSVRLDQVLDGPGDRLHYEYDFGDGWEHTVKVEAVLDEPPEIPCCLKGRLACPPEDCGGTWGYEELADWVRGGYDPAQVPNGLSAAEMRDWLPDGWKPDEFDLDQVNEALDVLAADPISMTGELAAIAERLRGHGVRVLDDLLSRSVWREPTILDPGRATILTEPYRILLDVLGDGVRLTSAGYMAPKVVEDFAARSGVTDWWIGKANREDITVPVARARASAQSLGLIAVRKGVLAPTAAGRRGREDHVALWQHIVDRLPAGRGDFDRQAGWLALSVVGAQTPAEEWSQRIADLLAMLGWHSTDGRFRFDPPADSPTLNTLEILAGELALGRAKGVDTMVAATARAALLARQSEPTRP